MIEVQLRAEDPWYFVADGAEFRLVSYNEDTAIYLCKDLDGKEFYLRREYLLYSGECTPVKPKS